jgi:hypothetical protein
MGANTIGTVRVTCHNAAVASLPLAMIASGPSATNSRVFAYKVLASAPAGVDANVAAVGPAQLLQPLQKRSQAALTYPIDLGDRHEQCRILPPAACAP